jgi:hypothetical protein
VSSIYEWTDRALALPGAPDIWHRASEGQGLITVDGDEGLYGIASDGTWWEPTGRADRPWVLAVDHPATAGCLLAMLGGYASHMQCRVRPSPSGAVVWAADDPDGIFTGWLPLGRACIAYAAALGRWPGGEL